MLYIKFHIYTHYLISFHQVEASLSVMVCVFGCVGVVYILVSVGTCVCVCCMYKRCIFAWPLVGTHFKLRYIYIILTYRIYYKRLNRQNVMKKNGNNNILARAHTHTLHLYTILMRLKNVKRAKRLPRVLHTKIEYVLYVFVCTMYWILGGEVSMRYIQYIHPLIKMSVHCTTINIIRIKKIEKKNQRPTEINQCKFISLEK